MLRHYFLISAKVFARRPFFTFVSLFGICLTLVVLTLVAAFLDHTFGAVAPEVHTDRMLGVFAVVLESEDGRHYQGEASYRLLDRELRELDGAELVSLASVPQSAATFVDGRKVPLRVRHVDGAFFQLLEFQVLEGRTLTDEDHVRAEPVAVINLETRRRLFGDGPAIDQSFDVDNQRLRVVGVVANVPSFRPISSSDVWAPVTSAPGEVDRRGLTGRFQAFILARTRQDLGPVAEDVEARFASVDISEADGYDRLEVRAETLFAAVCRRLMEILDEDEEGGPPPAERVRLILAVGALLFMALPALNLVNLNVSRILERAPEIGVRKSFGASSRALALQFLVENLMLTVVGGLLGFVLAALCLEAVSGSAVVSYAELSMNFRIFGWGLGLAVVFGLVSGVYPAWKMSRLHPKMALEEGAS
ncbi:MAG: ABC transporter permease [Acidobacteriota bacterium]